MKKMISKAMAIVVAAMCMVAGVGALTAGATTINVVEGSKYEYTAYVEEISDTEIALVLRTTVNPGFTSLGYAVEFDPTYFKTIGEGRNIKTEVTPRKGMIASLGGDHLVSLQILNRDDITDNIEIRFYFETIKTPSNGKAEFKTCVFSYWSQTENLENSYSTPDYFEYDTVTEAKTGVEYIVGDVDNDKDVDQGDAYKTLSLTQKLTNAYGTVKTPTTRVNEELTRWLSVCPGLPCAEAADSDTDGYIEENDAYNIQLYTSQIALGQIGDIEDVGAKRLVSTTYEC